MEENDLKKIVPIIEKHNLIVFSDEIYGELVYDGLKRGVKSFVRSILSDG